MYDVRFMLFDFVKEMHCYILYYSPVKQPYSDATIICYMFILPWPVASPFVCPLA